jgi:hypothetical protein
MWNRRLKKTDLRYIHTYIVAPDSNDEKTLHRNRIVARDLADYCWQHFEIVKGAHLPRDPGIGCSLSHAIAVQQALKRDGPFLLLENDAVAKSLDFSVEMPHDADAVFVGISACGTAINASKPIHHTYGNYYSQCSVPNLVRIYNMLSTHAVLINSERFARNWLLCCMEAAVRNVPIDTVVARTQRHFNVYAQMDPIFYQAEYLGGQEKFTKISFGGTLIKSADDLPEQLRSFTPPCISADLAAMNP